MRGIIRRALRVMAVSCALIALSCDDEASLGSPPPSPALDASLTDAEVVDVVAAIQAGVLALLDAAGSGFDAPDADLNARIARLTIVAKQEQLRSLVSAVGVAPSASEQGRRFGEQAASFAKGLTAGSGRALAAAQIALLRSAVALIDQAVLPSVDAASLALFARDLRDHLVDLADDARELELDFEGVHGTGQLPGGGAPPNGPGGFGGADVEGAESGEDAGGDREDTGEGTVDGTGDTDVDGDGREDSDSPGDDGGDDEGLDDCIGGCESDTSDDGIGGFEGDERT